MLTSKLDPQLDYPRPEFKVRVAKYCLRDEILTQYLDSQAAFDSRSGDCVADRQEKLRLGAHTLKPSL
jgi:hypothetical protein